MGRRPFDFYETPPDYVESLLKELAIHPRARIIEPCVGAGAISRFLRHDAGELVTNDIDTARRADYHFDASDIGAWDANELGIFHWGITNPPFDPEIMVPILDCMFSYCDNVVTLARLSFLEPTASRREWWRGHQPDMCIVLPRYSFRRNDKGARATDSVTCAWLGWGPQVPKLFTVETQVPAWRAK